MVSTLDGEQHAYAVRSAKCALAANIATAITLRKMSQSAAADELDMTQPQISEIANGKVERYSLDHLIRINRKLGFGIDIQFYAIDPRDR